MVRGGMVTCMTEATRMMAMRQHMKNSKPEQNKNGIHYNHDERRRRYSVYGVGCLSRAFVLILISWKIFGIVIKKRIHSSTTPSFRFILGSYYYFIVILSFPPFNILSSLFLLNLSFASMPSGVPFSILLPSNDCGASVGPKHSWSYSSLLGSKERKNLKLEAGKNDMFFFSLSLKYIFLYIIKSKIELESSWVRDQN